MQTKSQLSPFFILLACFTGVPMLAQAQHCDGATIATPEGHQRVYTCPGDGLDDIVRFTTTSTAASSYAYAITNSDNVILMINSDNSQNFEGAGQGVCRVWGFSYTGNLLAKAGDNVFSTFFSDGCWAISATAIEVVRSQPDGGTVSMPNGQTQRVLCTQDGYSDPVLFRHQSNSAAAYTYVITDDQNNILGLPPSDNNDFEGVPSGVCRVWGLSYTGALTAMLGQNAASVALSDGCFDLSDNFIEIIRTNVDGGTVATSSGSNGENICVSDGTDDIFSFTHSTASASAYAYIITDNNNHVIGLPGNSQNFEGAGQGICLVWGISYTGNLTIWPGDDIFDKALSSDCFDLSSNFIQINRTEVNGGQVATTGGQSEVSLVAGDGIDDVISFEQTGQSGPQLSYIITDENNNILGIPPGNSQNFEGAGAGVCRVWGLAYAGNFLAIPGDNIDTDPLADDCFDLSDNFITIRRSSPGEARQAQVRDPHFKQEGFAIYPNPVLESLRLDIEEPVESASLEIFTLSGKLLRTHSDLTKKAIEVSSLDPGIYIVRLKAGGACINRRFVKI